MSADCQLIAMVPARMGSKRVPLKNLRYINGRPLVGQAVSLALEAGIFQDIWINSEAEILAVMAEEYGVKFHRRPDHLAGDKATNREFTLEFLEKHECDYVVIVNPTSPALRPGTIVDFGRRLARGDLDTLLTVVDEQAEMFYRGRPLNFDPARKINSQHLPVVRKVVWALSGWRRAAFLDLAGRGENPIFGGRMELFALAQDEACDIDTEADWRLAEAALKSRAEPGPVRYYPDRERLK